MLLVEPPKAWEMLGPYLPFTGAQRVPLDQGLGRILAEEIVCPRDIPAEDRALRDGYALGKLRHPKEPIQVLGESMAGRAWDMELPEGRAVGVRTGAVVPKGTLGIAPKEEVEESQDRSWVRLKGEPPSEGSYVGRKGYLFRAGSKLLGPGTRLGPGELSILAAAGFQQVWVGKRPRVLLLPTGSELAGPQRGLGSGQSFVSHARYLAWRIQEEGGVAGVSSPVPDSEEEIWRGIEEAVGRANLVVTTGGTGPSDRDLVCRALIGNGAQTLWKHLPMRPGSTISAFLVRSTPVIALPGGAGGVGLGCELLLAPSVRALQRQENPGPRWIECRVAEEILRDPVCHRFIEARLVMQGGLLGAGPLPRDFPGGGLVPLRGAGWIHVRPGEGSLGRGEIAPMLLGRCVEPDPNTNLGKPPSPELFAG